MFRRTGTGLLLSALLAAQFVWVGTSGQEAKAADNGLAQKPYMGWSSYSLQVYNPNGIDWVTADRVKAQSDAMHEKLQSHGYDYINIDAGWSGGSDEYGRPVPKATLYPNGFQEVVDYVHHNGQKIGLYMIPGMSKDVYEKNLPIKGTPYHAQDIVVKPLTTADYWNIDYKIDFSKPGAQEYVDSIAEQLGEWGVDFIKFDSVTPGSGHNDETIDARDDVKAWSTALGKYRIWFELSWALDHNYVDYWKKYANGWRVDWDVEAYNPDVGMTQWGNIARLFPDAAFWWRDAGPGGWNDFDSLDIGNGATSGLTKDERQTAMTLWAASSAQLYTGDDIANLDDYGLSLLTNDEVIAVNQAGHPIHPVSTASDQQVWYANNGDGTYTVALFNLGSKGASFGVNWNDIGLSGAASVRDLWSHQELGSFDAGYGPVTLEPHASRLFKVTALSGASTVNDDDNYMKYSGDWTRNGGNELESDAQDLSVIVTDSSASGAGRQNGDAGSDGHASDASGDTPPDPGEGADSAPVSHTVLLNDTDPAIQYANRWGYSGDRSFGDYGGDVHYGEPDDASGTQPEMTYAFDGTGIEVRAETSDSSGKLDVYVDGEFKETVDTYSVSQTGQIPVYGIAGLEQGPHTLRIVRNPDGGHYFLLDALKVTADSLLGTPSAGSFNQDQPADITVALPFGASSLAGIRNGDSSLQSGTDYTVDANVATIKSAYLQQQPSGDSVALAFEFAGGDTQLLPIAMEGTSISPTSASFDKRPTAQADVAVSLTLPDGNSLTGIRNGDASLTEGEDYAADGNTVRILKSYLSSLPVGNASLTFEFSRSGPRTLAVAVSNSASPGRYEFVNNNDPKIKYSGGWNGSGGRGLGDYGDDVDWTETNDAFFEYTFQGTGIDYITEVDQGQGDVEIFLDGVSQGTFSTYEANAHNKPQMTIYSVSGLASGLHTLKAVKKTGQFMLLDALRVQLPDLIDVSLTDFDKAPAAQADVIVNVLAGTDGLTAIKNGAQTLVQGADYTVSGNQVTIKKEYLASQPAGTTKLTFAFRGDYGDDVHAAAADGSSFEYTFKGTGVELLSPVGPKQGDMDIYIDGEQKATVSANAAKRGAQVNLYRSDSLPSGTHTIKVVKSSGDLMLVDALRFDVSPWIATPPVSPSGEGGVATGADSIPVVRTTLPDGTSKDEAKLTADQAKTWIDRQKAAGASALTISFPTANGGASLTNATLDPESVALLADSGLDLEIDAGSAKIRVPNASLRGWDDEVHFNLTPVGSADESSQIETRANEETAVIAASGGKATLAGRPVKIETNLENREVMLVLPLDDTDAQASGSGRIGVYIEHEDGTKEFKPGTEAAFDEGKGVQFTTSKFSTFAPLQLDDAASASRSAYIRGFAGDLFKPDQVITRAEMAAILTRVAGRQADDAGNNPSFRDVKPGYWGANAIAQAAALGLMNGYGDGTFKPEQPVTRAEMAALASRLAPSAAEAGTGFADTIGHWAEQAIKSAQGAGYLQGYADGTFRPERALTRAEAVVILNRALGRVPRSDEAQSPWKDVPNGYWAARDIAEASTDRAAGSGAGSAGQPAD
ncbi:X2-like carbohydrate binding domain-containing protein [Cohnella zeiphila]|nr:X2-like carbohydrate binding domain-containing protein [Cohnella zeiphila]